MGLLVGRRSAEGRAGGDGSAAIARGELRGGPLAEVPELGVRCPEEVGVGGGELEARDDLAAADGVGLARDGGAEQGEDFLFGDGLAADLVEDLVTSRLVLGQVARVADGGKVERRRREAEVAAVLDEGVEESIGRGVGGLAVVSDDAGDGREGDEEVEGAGCRLESCVHVPAAGDLGADNSFPLRELHIFEQYVLNGRF